jgi:chemotaxis protein methyltransferase CheR
MDVKTTDTFVRLRDLVSTECGFYFGSTNLDTLQSCIHRRMKAVDTADYEEYLEYIDCHAEGQAELRELVGSITVNETNFFRHPDQFKAFKEHVLPEIIDRKLSSGMPAEPIASIWSAGCATGDETYTIALQVREVVEPFYANNIEILGTDIDEDVLSHAKDALYSTRTLQYVGERHLETYFTAADGGYGVNEQLRRMVEFRYHNLVETPYPRARWGKWDVIFCRNVVIYFDTATMHRVINNIYKSLAEGGYLFLGYSESLNGITDKMTLCRFGDVFAYRKDVGSKARARSKIPAPEASSDRRPIAGLERMQDEVRRLLDAEKYKEAVKKATALVEKYPADAVANSLAARAHLEKGRHEEAAEAATRAIELDPLQTHAYFIMGIICENQQDDERAIRYLRRALYLDDTLAMAHVHLAIIYRKNGKQEDASREYKNAIRILENTPPGGKTEFAGGVNVQSILSMCKKSIAK